MIFRFEQIHRVYILVNLQQNLQRKENMEKVQWKVEGMDCTNCALTIRKYLEKEGLENVKVNFATGDVLFDIDAGQTKEGVAKGIRSLGYTVASQQLSEKNKKSFLASHLEKFLFCLPFTVLLMIHMIPGIAN